MSSKNHIPFNIPFLVGNENKLLNIAINKRKLSGNGHFTKLCHNKFYSYLDSELNLLTTSCTDALEMTSILSRISPDDEVIMPTFTFVSTANAFILRGAKIKFVDSRIENPNIDENKIEELINEKTKAIVPVHYAGVACNMDKIMSIAKKYNLIVIEDAAQAIDSFYKGKPLGSIGDMGCFSFHETKNIQCGEGGLLAINNSKFSSRGEIIWEKGTNRSAFWRGEVDKYNWVDIGSSFLPSEITSAFLYSQLKEMENIQKQRINIWNQYYSNLIKLENIGIQLPNIPSYATNNAHMFYITCRDFNERKRLILKLKENNIDAVFHYLCLHDSPFFNEKHDGRPMPNAKRYEECLVRLPLWVDMTEKEVKFVIQKVLEFYKIGSINVN